MTKLFTVANFKTRKGEAFGVKTLILHLAPADLGGPNVCPMSTPECRALCLNTAGRGIFARIQEARLRRTAEYHRDPAAFAMRLAKEVWTAYRSLPAGWTLAVRVNGTSDLPALAGNVARAFVNVPRIRFYDYTKIPGAMKRRDGVHRTFSASEHDNGFPMLRAGLNVAVVFNTPKCGTLPTSYLGHGVMDGDESDLRFLDPQGGYVIGLRAKGKARRNSADGFVVDAGTLA